MMLATTPAKATTTPERTEMAEAPPGTSVVLALAVGAEVPVLEVEPSVPLGLVVELEVVGVKGAVKPNPGSAELGTLAANAAKVFAPVAGGLIAPYIPPWQ